MALRDCWVPEGQLLLSPTKILTKSKWAAGTRCPGLLTAMVGDWQRQKTGLRGVGALARIGPLLVLFSHGPSLFPVDYREDRQTGLDRTD